MVRRSALCEEKIEAVEAALSGGPAYLGTTERGLLLKQLEQLQDKEGQLWDNMKQLRDDMKHLQKVPRHCHEIQQLLRSPQVRSNTPL